MPKPVPRYWWDFDPVGTVIVESDQSPRIVAFDSGNAAFAISKAQQLIRDLDAGRVNWKTVSKEKEV